MDTNFYSFPITDFDSTKQQVLSWVNQFSTCCFLDNHQYQFNHHSYECIAAAGAKDFIALQAGTALQQLHQFQQQKKGWLFGHLGYDLKNEIEELTSSHADNIAFPDLFFFIPNTVLLLRKDELCIEAANKNIAAEVFAQVSSMAIIKNEPVNGNIVFQQRFTKQEYIDTIEKLRQHILRGDCYEINFCQEFFSTNTVINPENVYRLLGEISPSPFAAFYKINEKYLICASPERYLKKEGNAVISQPIKGTGKRDLKNGAADDENKTQLFESAKDRSENVMIVDLVRNDLSKICIEGSVKVEELFGIYSFPQVHQMISTVRGLLQENISFASIIQQTFPMGSMTGAPKKKVMELIEKYENVKRGIFSGAVGYINPDGDFDFNVVIRSLLYNNETKYLSYLVGSGITFYSDPASEYEECLLKASAFKSMFSGQ